MPGSTEQGNQFVMFLHCTCLTQLFLLIRVSVQYGSNEWYIYTNNDFIDVLGASWHLEVPVIALIFIMEWWFWGYVSKGHSKNIHLFLYDSLAFIVVVNCYVYPILCNRITDIVKTTR